MFALTGKMPTGPFLPISFEAWQHGLIPNSPYCSASLFYMYKLKFQPSGTKVDRWRAQVTPKYDDQYD